MAKNKNLIVITVSEFEPQSVFSAYSGYDQAAAMEAIDDLLEVGPNYQGHRHISVRVLSPKSRRSTPMTDAERQELVRAIKRKTGRDQ